MYSTNAAWHNIFPRFRAFVYNHYSVPEAKAPAPSNTNNNAIAESTGTSAVPAGGGSAGSNTPRVLRLLYVKRTKQNKGGIWRTLLNVQELQTHFESKGYIVTMKDSSDWGAMTVREQLLLLRDTDVLVGIEGAGLLNVLYLQPGAVIVDLKVRAHVFVFGVW
jgi:capsular polysaccharide biosynthesis protein